MFLGTRLAIVLSSALSGAEATNAAAVLGLAASAYTSGLAGKAVDADGRGYNPALAVTAFTETARRSRDYDDYLSLVADTSSADIVHAGLGIYGPRSRVTALTKRLALYGEAS